MSNREFFCYDQRMKFKSIIGAVLLVFFAFPPISLHAASLTNISDTVSRLKTQEFADHTIQFTVNSGMLGGTITLFFNGAVSDMNAIDYSDIDLLYGPVGYEKQQALYLQPGTNVWGVDVDSKNKKIIFNYPLVSGFPILSNDRVIIKIGAHTTYDTLLTKSRYRQLKNGDAALGGQQIQILTQFESGRLAVPIVTEDSIGMFCRDALSAPTEVKAENSAGIVRLSWTDTANNESGFFIERSQEISSASGDAVSTHNTPFDTILTIQSSNASQAVDSKIMASTIYHYRVRAYNTCGFSEYSQTSTVKTPSGSTILIMPMMLAPIVQPVLRPTIPVSIEKPALPPIEKVPELPKEPLRKQEPPKKPIESEKPKEIKKQPPKEEPKKPEFPKGIPNVGSTKSSSTINSVIVQWQNPSVDNFDSVQIQRSEASFPQSISSGVTAYRGSASSFTDAGLAAGKIYYYTIFSLSKSGTSSSGSFLTAATKALPDIPIEEIERQPLQEPIKQSNISEIPTMSAPDLIQPNARQQAMPLPQSSVEPQQNAPAQEIVQTQSAMSALPLPPPAPAILSAPQVSAVYAPVVVSSTPLPPPAIIVSLPIVESAVVIKSEESQRTSSIVNDATGTVAAFTVDISAHTFSEEAKIAVTPLSTVQARTIDTQATIPAGHEAVGDIVYKIQIRNKEGRSVKKFDKPLRLTFRYNKSLVQTMNEQSLKVYYWESSLMSWIPLPSSIDIKTGIIVAEVSHATLFSIFGEHRKDMTQRQRESKRVEAQSVTAVKKSESYLFRPEDMHATAFSKIWGSQVNVGFNGATFYATSSAILDLCIPTVFFGADIDTVTLTIEDAMHAERYFLKNDEDRKCYATSIIAPKSQGVYSFSIKSKDADDRMRSSQFSLMVLPAYLTLTIPPVLYISEYFGTPELAGILLLLICVLAGYVIVDVRKKTKKNKSKK